MKKICCFGEILMRVSPPDNWIERNQLQVYIGGAEANVATALANWNMPVKYLTAIPDNYVGRDIETYLQQKNIDTSGIAWQGNRVGLYYMQQGVDLKHSGVIYDRFYSSFYELKPGDINWDEVFEDVSWFHFTAISPALNINIAAVCKEALEAAQAKGITISVDLNYRAKLWKYGKDPVEVMPELVQYCDVIMGNIWAANTLLGISLDKNVEVVNQKGTYLDHAIKTSAEIQQKFPKCKTIAYTFRFDEPSSGIKYYAALYRDNTLYSSRQFELQHIADKAGSGDCFMAGLIYGLQHQHKVQDIIDFASAAAFGKLSEIGDASKQTVEDVQKHLT
ncbi:MAG: sugar kinase [Taibaiella sp.]|jgi:2-dehydro-3-deoxygluconokinase